MRVRVINASRRYQTITVPTMSKDVSRFRFGLSRKRLFAISFTGREGKLRDTFKISHFLHDIARIPPCVRMERLWESNSELSIRTAERFRRRIAFIKKKNFLMEDITRG